MAKLRDCRARQHSDQMHCASCGLIWDITDPEPPTCRQVKVAVDRPSYFPELLPDDVAIDMLRAFTANGHDGMKGRITAMQAVYRLLIDRLGI